jgi:polar amino acid transport system substrate-binding protein
LIAGAARQQAWYRIGTKSSQLFERRVSMKRRQEILILVTVLVISMGLAGAAAAGKIQQELTGESTIENALKRGVLRVGMSTFVPWAMKDKTGKLIGFEIDVANRLAQDTGVEIEFVPTKWAGIIPALLTGKFDVIIGGMGILPQRNLKVNFTIPYDYSGMSIVAHKQLAAGFKRLEEFNRPEVKIAARLGSTAEMAVRKYMPQAKLQLFDDESQVIQELRSGRVHAMVASAPLPTYLAIENPEVLFLPLQETFTKEPIGFAVRKGDVDTLNYFNNWIRVVEAEGWLKERKQYWFNTKEWEKQLK